MPPLWFYWEHSACRLPTHCLHLKYDHISYSSHNSFKMSDLFLFPALKLLDKLFPSFIVFHYFGPCSVAVRSCSLLFHFCHLCLFLRSVLLPASAFFHLSNFCSIFHSFSDFPSLTPSPPPSCPLITCISTLIRACNLHGQELLLWLCLDLRVELQGCAWWCWLVFSHSFYYRPLLWNGFIPLLSDSNQSACNLS